MIYKLGLNLPKKEIYKRIHEYEELQAKIERLETRLERMSEIIRELLKERYKFEMILKNAGKILSREMEVDK